MQGKIEKKRLSGRHAKQWLDDVNELEGQGLHEIRSEPSGPCDLERACPSPNVLNSLYDLRFKQNHFLKPLILKMNRTIRYFKFSPA